jgi:3-hydroxybutyryl-CoA dehydrogenase
MSDGSMGCAVAGGGLMGAAIAQVLAAAGHDVALYDPSTEVRSTVPTRMREIFALLEEDPEGPMSRVTVTGDLAEAVAVAGFVVEAGPERLAVKQEIFEQLDNFAPPEAILASNTSGIPIGRLGSRVADRSRVVGTHFWHPPYLVPLVEVVQGDETSESVVSETCRLLAAAGMKPVPLRSDIPGFVGNRLQHALKREAIALVASGVCDAEALDTVVKYGFGLRLAHVGPLEQSDLIGLDLTLAIHETIMPALDVTAAPHPLLVEKVRNGDLGVKTGKGFRSWTPETAGALRERLSRALLAAARTRRREQAVTTGSGT